MMSNPRKWELFFFNPDYSLRHKIILAGIRTAKARARLHERDGSERAGCAAARLRSAGEMWNVDQPGARPAKRKTQPSRAGVFSGIFDSWN